MKNKEAFTLVELLGVIVVLAILALITIPIISNVINDVRIKALQSSAYGLIEASNLYYAQYGTNNNLRFNITGNKVQSSDTDKLLTYKGSVKEGTVILDKKGQVTVCVTDGKNSAYKNYNESKVTTKKGDTCYINDNSSIVYLTEEGATINTYDDAKLTELVIELQQKVESQNSQITNLSNRLSETNASMISLNDVYPVGSIYISTTEDTVAKVQAKFGGTWVSFGSGRTLVGVDTSDSDFNTVEKEAGEKKHTLITAEMPSHTHLGLYWSGYRTGFNGGSGTEGGYYISQTDAGSSSTVNTYFRTGSEGGNGAHNNLQPYITVYMYKRTS